MLHWPASSSSIRAKSAGLSKRGTHHQATDPFRDTSAAQWQSDSNPYAAMAALLTAADRCDAPGRHLGR